MGSIERRIGSITEDRRADYLFDTQRAADALHVHPNRFHDWWYRTHGKLLDLYIAQPGETAAEFMAIIAAGEAERQRRLKGANGEQAKR